MPVHRVLTAFFLTLATAAAAPAARVVAVGDVHGELEGFVGILEAAGLIDGDRHWVGDDAVLVQTGDLTDRGPDVRAVLDLVRDLQGEAEAAGGEVVVLLGNHELQNVLWDFYGVTPEIFASWAGPEAESLRKEAFREWKSWLRERARARGLGAPSIGREAEERWFGEHPPGFFEYTRAMGPEGSYGRWLRSLPVAVVRQGVLFHHGGISPTWAGRTLAEIGETHRRQIERHASDREALAEAGLVPAFFSLVELDSVLDEHRAQPRPGAEGELLDRAVEGRDALQRLLVADAPTWYRGYARMEEAELERHVGELRRTYGVERLVSGHTPFRDGQIHVRAGGEVLLIDTGMLTRYYGGRASALEIDDGGVRALYRGSSEWIERPPVPESPPAAAAWLGADGRPLVLDDGALEEILAHGRILERTTLGSGVTRPTKLLLEGSDRRVHGILRSVDIERDFQRYRDGRMVRYFKDSWRNELAAYRLDRLLGLHRVPPVVERRVAGKAGSVQLWIEGAPSKEAWDELHPGEDPIGSSPVLEEQVDEMRIFDNLIHNIDRHDGNFLFGADDRIWWIDHTRAFNRSPELPQRHDVRRCSFELLEALRGLDRAAADAALREYLSSWEIDALVKRRDLLVELLDARVEELGEEAVLFSTDHRPGG